jgi:uncharacterized DUF497 family protein
VDFEWGPKKEKANLVKHSVSFREAMTVFGDPLELTIADPDHSDVEDRYLSIGMSSANRLLIVSYTERDHSIRIINARAAVPRERKQYESGNEFRPQR